jgi:transposase
LPVNCPATNWLAKWRPLKAISAAGTRGAGGAAGKVAVFDLLKWKGKVYPAVIPAAKTATILPIIKEKVRPDRIVYTDPFGAYNALDVAAFHHVRINHSARFAEQGHHINGIEHFWNQAKRYLCRFNSLKKKPFYWFLQECAWRFNAGDHKNLLNQLKYWYKTSKH